VSTLDDLRAVGGLVDAGVEGAIIGKALYVGAFTLQGALAAVNCRYSKWPLIIFRLGDCPGSFFRLILASARAPTLGRLLMRQFARHAVRIAAVTGFAIASMLAAGIPASAVPAYTALGDSYSSGTGTRTYYSDSPSCQRSPYAYPVIDNLRLGAALTFVACAGARVADVQNNQLGSLNGSTSYVTVSVGGNDAGFSSVISACARPWPYTCWTEINNANNFIRNTLPGRLSGLYTTIRGRAPSARVVVVGYPRIFNGEECNFGARISPGEQAELNRTADLLATTTAAAAGAAGFPFADVRGVFTGHAVCDDVEWINGLSNPIGESYHPNIAGHANGYAGLVEIALRGTASTAA
jgi:hypothetical protein